MGSLEMDVDQLRERNIRLDDGHHTYMQVPINPIMVKKGSYAANQK